MSGLSLRERLAGNLLSWKLYHFLFADYSFLDRIFKLPIVREYLGPHAGTTLDFGCGGGTYTDLLSRKTDILVNADIQYHGLRRLSRRYRHYEKIHSLVSIASKIPLADKSLDTIICLEVLEHLPEGEDRACLEEFARILRRGGKFILSTPVPPGYVDDPSNNPYGHKREGYTLMALSEMLVKAGFCVDRSEYCFFRVYKWYFKFLRSFFEIVGIYPPSILVLPVLFDYFYAIKGSQNEPGNVVVLAIRV